MSKVAFINLSVFCKDEKEAGAEKAEEAEEAEKAEEEKEAKKSKKNKWSVVLCIQS